MRPLKIAPRWRYATPARLYLARFRMLSPNALHNLELLARQAVEGFIIGLHRSPFHGFSVEFAEHRLYNPGDAPKRIDWRVYGRTDKLFVKRFEEETNLRCCLVLDTSSSMHFPQDPARMSKLQFSAFAAAALLQLLKRQQDAAALALFAEGLTELTECRSASSHFRQLTARLEALVSHRATGQATAAAAALHEVAERMHKRSLVIVFTDAVEGADDPEALFAALQHLRYNKHEVILFQVADGKQELSLDFPARPYEFVDLETGDRLKIQPAQERAAYNGRVAAFWKTVEDRCHALGIDRVAVDLSEPVDAVLAAFLTKRAKLL